MANAYRDGLHFNLFSGQHLATLMPVRYQQEIVIFLHDPINLQ